jgi:phytoene synthase
VNAPVSTEITKQSGSNLALAFVLLPPEKRAAMSALYAYCRQVDDIADEDAVPVGDRAEELARWRSETLRASEGGQVSIPVLRELQPFMAQYRLPFRLFDELITGVEMDLVTTRHADPAALEKYCYHVASVVGLLSIEVFGYRDPACRDYADALGKALQLTNILRDVGNDAQRGRIYLPLSDLAAHGVTEEEILAGHSSDRFRALARTMADRARGFYARARAVLPKGEQDSMMTAELMGAVYWRLLVELEARQFPVLSPKPWRLSRARKLGIVFRMWLGWKAGLRLKAYGD